jgi:hypothetical protein
MKYPVNRSDQEKSFDQKFINNGFMADIKLKQIQHESDTWKRLLAFIKDENIYLKNRLSDVLRDRQSNDLLDEMENFQNRFVEEDDRIGLLHRELTEFDRLLVREVFGDGLLKKKVDEKVKSLRKRIQDAENGFSRLKSEFNNYLLANL